MKRILVVDDEKVLAETVALFLGRRHYRVRCVYDVVSAQKAIEREKPDVVISDLVMPGQDGFQLLQWIRENCIATAFILMTVKSSVFSPLGRSSWKPDAFLGKPFTAGEFRQVVRMVLRKPHLQKEVNHVR